MIGPLPYIGGKRRIAPLIVKLLPPHVTYVEPFAGGAQVFFHKPRSPVEVLNDLDGELVNYLRVVQQHSPELVRWLRHMVSSRALHALFSRQDPTQLTDVQRAARFVYLQKNSFGGRVTRRTFNVPVTHGIAEAEIIASKLPDPGSTMAGDFGEILVCVYQAAEDPANEPIGTLKWRLQAGSEKARSLLGCPPVRAAQLADRHFRRHRAVCGSESEAREGQV